MISPLETLETFSTEYPVLLNQGCVLRQCCTVQSEQLKLSSTSCPLQKCGLFILEFQDKFRAHTEFYQVQAIL